MPILTVGKERSEFQCYYETHGNGLEKVVLVMGFLTSCEEWHRQLEYLKQYEDYEVCVLDNRGIGNSSDPKGNYSSKDMAKDIIEIMDHLKWDKFHLVGISMGGMISIELGTLFSYRLKSLTLAVTHAGSLPPIKGMISISQSMITLDPRKRGEVVLPVLYSTKYLAEFSLTEPTRTNKEVLLDRYVEKSKNAKPPSLSCAIGHIKTVLTHSVSVDRLNKLKDSKIPISILTGTEDYLVKASNSHFLNNILEPIEFTVFQGSGHVINVENQSEFNEALLRNFKRGSFSK